jgi:hypothetical protein
MVTEGKRADDVDRFWIKGLKGRRTVLVSEDDNDLNETDLRQAISQMNTSTYTCMDTSANNDTASYHVSP